MTWKSLCFVLLSSCVSQANVATSLNAVPTPEVAAPNTAAADEYFNNKDFTQAATLYQKATTEDPKNGRAWFRLALSYHFSGRLEDAIKAYQVADSLKAAPRLIPYNLACAYAMLGQKEAAFTQLDLAVSRGFKDVATMSTDTDLVSLHNDPRFEAALTKAKESQPGCDSAESKQFDFWVGDWSVYISGQEVGTNSIEKILNGCALQENWAGRVGDHGKSFNTYNTGLKQWQQHWVDDQGNITTYLGSWKDNAMVFLSQSVDQKGTPQYLRMTFTPIDENTVRQLIENSTDQGKSWTPSFDGKYQRKTK
jgi:tetratricopeptide (TPR) repeat protein